MKKLSLYLTLLFAPALSLFAEGMSGGRNEITQDGTRFDQESNERDFDALRQYLNTMREVPLEDKDNNLSISGDVRFEWRHMREQDEGYDIRGRHRFNPDSRVPVSRNDFDCEFNLKFDYIMDRSWAVAHLQYDNSAGVDSEDQGCSDDPHGWFGSGKCDDICLRKAFFGYNFVDDNCGRLDIEVGRRGNLYNVFDSRVQFLSRMDGVLLKWGSQWENIPDVYLKVAGFVVDERVNHFAYATELGFLNIYDSGFDFKYSFIDWGPNSGGRCIEFKGLTEQELKEGKYHYAHKPRAFQFQISQFTLAYHLDPCLLGRPAKLFGAFLVNHACPNLRTPESDEYPAKSFGHQNCAWYVGATIGEVNKEGDWSLEVQYQVVQAAAVPGQDMSGIGTGNNRDWTLTHNRRDNTNFKGWKVEGLYALTDNITIDSIIEASRALKPKIGGERNYSKVEVEAIYAF